MYFMVGSGFTLMLISSIVSIYQGLNIWWFEGSDLWLQIMLWGNMKMFLKMIPVDMKTFSLLLSDPSSQTAICIIVPDPSVHRGHRSHSFSSLNTGCTSDGKKVWLNHHPSGILKEKALWLEFSVLFKTSHTIVLGSVSQTCFGGTFARAEAILALKKKKPIQEYHIAEVSILIVVVDSKHRRW